MKNRNYYIAGAVVALLLVSYFLGRCSTKQERDNAVNNILALKDTVHASVVTINGLTNYVSEQKALILSQSDALASSELEKTRLKALALKSIVTESSLNGTIKTLRDSLKLVPGTTIITVDDTTTTVGGGTAITSHDYVQVPFTLLDEQDTNLHLIAGMNINKQAYFSLSAPFNGTITVGYKKTGFLKTTPVGIFTTTNPYIKVDNMSVVIVKEPDKIWNKWWFHAIGGAVVFETARQLLLK